MRGHAGQETKRHVGRRVLLINLRTTGPGIRGRNLENRLMREAGMLVRPLNTKIVPEITAEHQNGLGLVEPVALTQDPDDRRPTDPEIRVRPRTGRETIDHVMSGRDLTGLLTTDGQDSEAGQKGPRTIEGRCRGHDQTTIDGP
jgi:hypothetical protein